MLDQLGVILVRPKFPENIGMAARACANMGCSELVVTAPQLWNPDKSAGLATAQGLEILRTIRVTDTLSSALSGFDAAFGTTARTGGWRKGVLTPAKAAAEINEARGQGRRVALVFGPEDRGLENEDVRLCSRLVCIPTAEGASSLNLAQAVLILLYECFKTAPSRRLRVSGGSESRPASVEEHELLYGNIEETLAAIDFFKNEHTAYWMLPVRRFIGRVALRRHEFNLLMGLCRQIKWLAGKTRD
jgi:tRNA/rRNA methyltransferase